MAFPEELGPAFFDTRNVSVGELGRKRGEGDLFVVAFLLSFFGKRNLFLIHYFLKAVLVISRDFVFENEHLSLSDFSFFEDGVGSLGEEVQIPAWPHQIGPHILLQEPLFLLWLP